MNDPLQGDLLARYVPCHLHTVVAARRKHRHTDTHTHTHAYHRHRCFALYAGRRPLTLNSRLVVDKVLPRTFTVSLFVVGAAALLIASELN